MRHALILAAMLLAGPALAQTGGPARSFCDGQVSVLASARGATDGRGNFVEYYAFVSTSGDALTGRAVTIGFAPPPPVMARDPQRVSLREGRSALVLGHERRAGGSVTPTIPRDSIGNYLTVQCP